MMNGGEKIVDINKGNLKTVILDFENKVFKINGQDIGNAEGLNLTFANGKWNAAIEFKNNQQLYQGRIPYSWEANSRPHKQTADELTNN